MVERAGNGGLAHYTHALCGALAAAGVRVRLLTAPREALPPTGAPYPVSVELRETHTRSRGAGLALEIWNVCVLLAVIARRRPGAVVLQAASAARTDEFLVPLLRLLRRRVVWVAHDVAQFETGGRLRPWECRLYRRVDAVVVLSEAERTTLLAQVPATAQRVAVIPHGEYGFLVGELIERAEARRRLGLSLETSVLLQFGYLKRYKGLEDLIEAVAVLRGRGRDVTAVIAGTIADVPVAELQERIDSLGLGHAVVLFPRYASLEETDVYFAAADAVVLPYRQATQSGVLHMAFGYRRPVVVTDVGGLPEYVRPGSTGEVARPGDPASIADAVERVLRPGSVAGDEFSVSEEHTWPSVAKGFMTVLEAVREGRPVNP